MLRQYQYRDNMRWKKESAEDHRDGTLRWFPEMEWLHNKNTLSHTFPFVYFISHLSKGYAQFPFLKISKSEDTIAEVTHLYPHLHCLNWVLHGIFPGCLKYSPLCYLSLQSFPFANWKFTLLPGLPSPNLELTKSMFYAQTFNCLPLYEKWHSVLQAYNLTFTIFPKLPKELH